MLFRFRLSVAGPVDTQRIVASEEEAEKRKGDKRGSGSWNTEVSAEFGVGPGCRQQLWNVYEARTNLSHSHSEPGSRTRANFITLAAHSQSGQRAFREEIDTPWNGSDGLSAGPEEKLDRSIAGELRKENSWSRWFYQQYRL